MSAAAVEVRTAELTVTETHVVSWANLTGDWLPIHMSAEHARESSFGERLVHGPLTMALAIGLSTRTPVIDPVLTRAWLGLRDLRAVAPVFIGDTIHAVVSIAGERPAKDPEQSVVELSYTVRNQRAETVMTFLNVVLVDSARQ
ncbi:MaoC/PaaZ C-terminal domain-containing protein [Pseudonocardia halophobica]|uniref:MaoC/PaaZ C-terminal domain-containing protein n=1 Tax=Pseudonocardia halophobica TaxID=29401 RepID=UPI003D901DE4